MPEDGNVKSLTYIAAVAEAQRWALRTYPEVIVYGEDVGKPGGPYGSAKNLQAEFGAQRVFDTPISETAMLGAAVGAAMCGLRPIVEIMFADFLLVAMDPVVNQAANVRYVSQGAYGAPLVIRTQQGATPGSCAQHSQNLEAMFAHVPGLRVGIPSNPQDAYDMLRSAAASDDPVMVIENRSLYPTRADCVLDTPVAELGGARVLRPGDDVTLLSWSRALRETCEAAETLAENGISAEVIDLRWVNPLDLDTVVTSVRRTRRLAIVHEANVTGGLGAEIAAQVGVACFGSLAAPVERIGAPDVRMPASPVLQAAVLPSARRVVESVSQMF